MLMILSGSLTFSLHGGDEAANCWMYLCRDLHLRPVSRPTVVVEEYPDDQSFVSLNNNTLGTCAVIFMSATDNVKQKHFVCHNNNIILNSGNGFIGEGKIFTGMLQEHGGRFEF